jgi:hypothetical protein
MSTLPHDVQEAVDRDLALLGTGFALRRPDGTYERLDPAEVIMFTREPATASKTTFTTGESNPVPDIKSQFDLQTYADRIRNGTVWIERRIYSRPSESEEGYWEPYALVPRDEADEYIEWETKNRHVFLRVSPKTPKVLVD